MAGGREARLRGASTRRSYTPFVVPVIACVNPTRLFRTTSFRLTAIYAGLFAVSAGLLFGIIYWIATNALHEQARLTLESELTALQEQFSGKSLDPLPADVSQRVTSGNI